jgi:hypothetical protein
MWNARSTRKLLRGEMSLANVRSLFTKSGSKSDDDVLAAEGAFAFHTVKYHSSYKTMDCMYVLFCSATTYQKLPVLKTSSLWMPYFPLIFMSFFAHY